MSLKEDILELERKTRQKTSSEEWLKYYTPKFQGMVKEEAIPKIEKGLADKFINARELRRIYTLIDKADLRGFVRKLWKKYKGSVQKDDGSFSLKDEEKKMSPEEILEKGFYASVIRWSSYMASDLGKDGKDFAKVKEWSSGNIKEDWETKGCKEALKALGGKMPRSIQSTITEIEKMFSDFAPLQKQLDELDGYGMTKAEQQKYIPPASSNAGVKKVEKILRDLMERSKKEFQDYLFDSYWESIEKFLKERKPTDTKYGADASDWAKKYTRVVGGESEPTISYKEHEERAKKRRESLGRWVSISQVSDKKESWDSPKEYELVPNAKSLLKKEVESQVENVQLQFVNKNLSKLTSIVEAKGDFKDAKEGKITWHRGLFEGDMAVSFEDGSKFSVKNQIVFTISVLGNPFYRFPTTFHDIEWQGQKFKMKPEKWMNESFAKATKMASLIAEIQSLEKYAKKEEWQVISPDGFRIQYEPASYPSLKAAKDAFKKWKKGYEAQGYYSSSHGRIDLSELEDHCQFNRKGTRDWKSLS